MLITDKVYAPVCNIITSQGCVLVFKESPHENYVKCSSLPGILINVERAL